MEIFLLRHACTPGNALGRYIGSTDEPLSPEGERQARHLGEKLLRYRSGKGGDEAVVISPMLRCRQSATLALGVNTQTGAVVEKELRECDFGLFENKNYKEMAGDPLYQKWVDSNGKLPFPGGEDPAQFRRRSCRAFEEIICTLTSSDEKQLLSRIFFVIHGGSIMSILEQYGRDQRGRQRPFYDWHVSNACGYRTALLQDQNGCLGGLRVLEEIG